MTLTVRSASVTGATTANRALTHAEMDANWAHVISSANQSFAQSGTGAVSRTVQAKLRDVISAADFGVVGDGVTDDTTALQNWLNAISGKTGYLPAPTSYYQVTTGLLGPTTCTIIGENRNTTLIRYSGSTTISGGAILRFSEGSHIVVNGIGVRWGSLVAGNASIGLLFRNSVYVVVDGFSHGGTAAAGANRTRGVVFDQDAAGYTPPRGNVVFRNILCVTESGDSGGGSSAGIHVQAIAGQSMNHVIFEGEGDLEHHTYGIKCEYANNVRIGQGWQLRGATGTELSLVSCSNVIVDGPQIIPTATTGTGIAIDSGCVDVLLLSVGWNISGGAPLALLTDAGSRTSHFPPGAPGASSVAGKLSGPMAFSKADGIGPLAKYTRGTTDDQSVVEMLRSGSSMGQKAYLGMNNGSAGTIDFVRVEGGSTLLDRMDVNGQRYVKVPTSSPGNAQVGTSQMTWYLNEAGNTIVFLVRYSDGTTVKAGTVAVV
jgi:hypothetical protein